MHEPTPRSADATLLEVENLDAGYGPLQILWGVSLHVRRGEFVALVGPNGSGKTTLLRAIAGLVRPAGGRVRFRGNPVTGLKTNERSRSGLGFIPEDLNLFCGLSVRDNLLLGAYATRDRKHIADRLSFVFGLFPALEERLRQLAGTLSGGEQKMLAIARGLMSEPLLLLVDEPSLGLAPNLVQEVFEAVVALNRQGVAILLTEQNVNRTLHMTTRAYVLEQGRIAFEGASGELLESDHIRKSYLGLV